MIFFLQLINKLLPLLIRNWYLDCSRRIIAAATQVLLRHLFGLFNWSIARSKIIIFHLLLLNSIIGHRTKLKERRASLSRPIVIFKNLRCNSEHALSVKRSRSCIAPILNLVFEGNNHSSCKYCCIGCGVVSWSSPLDAVLFRTDASYSWNQLYL